MNQNIQSAAPVCEERSAARKVHEWITSENGRRTLSEVLLEGKQATLLLERDCRVKRESLHEPVTV